MATPYTRNVPDEAAARLRERAKHEGLSLNALALRELATVARRPTNAELLASLPSHPTSAQEIVAIIEEGRRERGQQIDDAVRGVLGY